MEPEPCVLTKQFVLKQHKLFKQIDILFPTYNGPLSSILRHNVYYEYRSFSDYFTLGRKNVENA